MFFSVKKDKVVSYLEEKYGEVFNLKSKEFIDGGYEICVSCAGFPDENIIARIPDKRNDNIILDNFLTVFFRRKVKIIFEGISKNVIDRFKLYIPHSVELISGEWNKNSDIYKLLGTSQIIMPFCIILPPTKDNMNIDEIKLKGDSIANELKKQGIYQIFNMYSIRDKGCYLNINETNYISYIHDNLKLFCEICF